MKHSTLTEISLWTERMPNISLQRTRWEAHAAEAGRCYDFRCQDLAEEFS